MEYFEDTVRTEIERLGSMACVGPHFIRSIDVKKVVIEAERYWPLVIDLWVGRRWAAVKAFWLQRKAVDTISGWGVDAKDI